MKLYCVRHGQTDFNKNRILQGKSIDEPLNESGVAEMQEVLSKLPTDFEVIYSSSHKRVLSSAEMISAYSGKQIIFSPDIEEKDFGSLAGKYWPDFENGEMLHQLDRQQQFDYRPYGGESVDDVTARINAFLEMVKNSGHQAVLAVTSLGILRLLYKIVEHKVVLDIKNASVHTFNI